MDWIFGAFFRDYSRRVYHLVTSAEIKISWIELIECGRWILLNKMPMNGVVWYPGGSIKTNRWQHNICNVLFQWIPAILLDCLLFCLRYPPMWVEKMHKHKLHRPPSIIFLFLDFAEFNDASKKVSTYSNIMPTINGTSTIAIFSICAQS